MFSFVARQAIFDENLQTFGYELLFRDSMANRFPNVSPEHATAQLIEEQFFGAPGDSQKESCTLFVNFPYEMLLQGLAETLPKDRVVIEILETAEPTSALLATIKRLHQQGFRVALDDFSLSADWDIFIPFISIIKFDIRENSWPEIQDYLLYREELLKNTLLLAEKIETFDEYELFKNAGFTLFQGYFFSKPVVYKSNKLVQNHIVSLNLIQEVNSDAPNLQRIEDLLKHDVALSYKVMRYAQNILYNTRGIKGTRSHSLKDIVVYLGAKELRRFVLVTCLSSMKNVKTNETYYQSLIRAKFCELAAARLRGRVSANDAFMVGLFSLLDAVFEIPLEELIGQVVISQDVRMALQQHRGLLHQFVGLAELYEQRKWEEASQQAYRLGLTRGMVAEMMSSATQWADEMPVNAPLKASPPKRVRVR